MTEEAKVVPLSDYFLKLKNRTLVADKTLELRFDMPTGMTFEAGQYMDLTLIDPPETDAEGNTRGFSINSAPDDTELIFTTRLRDTAFKRAIQTIPLGTKIKLEGPGGDFTLHNNASRPAIFLAGGIGITPFRSIIRRATHEKLPHELFLFYSNNRPEDAAFLDEFRELARQNPKFTFVPTMTEAKKSQQAWEGETGFVTYEMIQKHIGHSGGTRPGMIGPIYYIAGPPPMVAGLRSVLMKAGVDRDDIRTEGFTGYP